MARRSRSPHPRRAVIIVVALAVGAAACGSGSGALSGDQVARAAVQQARRAYPGVHVAAGRCPRQITVGNGHSSTCTVQIDGVALAIRVTRDHRNGKLVFRALSAVLTSAALQFFVQAHLSLPATIDCGPSPVQIVAPDGELTCHVAFADGSMQSVRLRILDVLGNAVVEAPS